MPDTVNKDTTDNLPESPETPTFSEADIAEMSAALVRKFGDQAINMASFFLDEHLELQDHARAESWLRVMAHLDLQYNQSPSEANLH